MKIRDHIKIIICFMIIFIVGIGLGYFISNYQEGYSTFIDNINLAITLGISLSALLFAMITYFSIDAVDKKNRVDNNLLEAENYSVAYKKMLVKLNCKDKDEFQEELRKSVIECGKINSCMQFTDWIQNIIDHIILFTYYDWNNEAKIAFIAKLEKQYNRYSEIGSKVKILLGENIGLIKQILNYQDNRKKNKNVFSSIEDVRGRMLPNPIAQIVYYDYLGLDYRKQASEMMKKDSDKEFSKEYFQKWKDVEADSDTIKKCVFLAQTAQKNFERACNLANDDILWMGYLKYNLVRTEIMLFLLSNDKSNMLETIYKNLESCVEVRENVCLLFSEEGYLAECFKNEKINAKQLQSDFCDIFK